MEAHPYKIAIVAGEESGQLLGSDLIAELNKLTDYPVELAGVGGDRLVRLGLKSIFDPSEIAITGISGVIKSLPRLIRRVTQTASAITDWQPDCLILIDSPDFSLRVAKRVKAKLPQLPVVKYVAPSVWAWRPGRAKKMAAYIDAILAILPFEPEAMKLLGGPETHYVGHRLVFEQELTNCWNHNRTKSASNAGETLNLLLLPGSRSGEIQALTGEFGKAANILAERDHKLNVLMPTTVRLEAELRDLVSDWMIRPKITTTRDEQIAAYQLADCALAASGTVTLELALGGVPAISCYKLDLIMRAATGLINTWSAALPNLIADRPIIREFYNDQVRADLLARCVEELVDQNGEMRRHVIGGYAEVRKKMTVKDAPSRRSAEIVLNMLENG